MKKFYLLRHEDLHGHAGLGTVAEGVIFDNGMVAMTWLSQWETLTMFKNIRAVKDLHGHEGRTEVIVEGNRKQVAKFEQCVKDARVKTTRANKVETEE